MSRQLDQPVAEFIAQSSTFHQRIDTVYEPLDETRTQIRLMHILPGQFEDEEIKVTLSIVNIDADIEHKPMYEALSYTWDSLTPTKTIDLCDAPYQVTTNQYAALRRLRLPEAQRTLWMDVTCINQTDVIERSRQVSIMDQIYANAIQTRIWLGEPQLDWSEITDHDWNAHVQLLNSNSEQIAYMTRCAKASPAEIAPGFLSAVAEQPDGILRGALHFLKLLSECLHVRYMPYCYLDKDGELVHCRAFYEVLEMSLSLLNRPWWTRVWVLQEACLSGATPLVHIGGQTVSIRAITDSRNGWLQCWSDWQRGDRCLGDVYNLPAFIQAIGRLTTYGNALETLAHKFGKLNLPIGLGLVNERSAGDRRDFVYGIMGVVKPDNRVDIDYSLNVAAVFALTSWRAFSEHKHGFDMLKEAAGVTATDIPSWAIDWAKRDEAHFADSDVFVTAEENDPELTQCFHLAGVLQVTANKIDKIGTVLKTSENLESPTDDQGLETIQSWVQQLHAEKLFPEEDLLSNNSSLISNLLTTVFRETRRNEQGKMARCPSDDDWTAVIQWFKDMQQAVDADGTDHESRISDSSIAKDFRAAIRGSVLCITEQGRLCLAADSVQAGDILYHVRGCCLPLALRSDEAFELEWVEEDDGPLIKREIEPFKVVGPCYLKGSMGLDGTNAGEETVTYLV